MRTILRWLVLGVVLLTAGFGERQELRARGVAAAEAAGPIVVTPTLPLAPSPSGAAAGPEVVLVNDYRLPTHLSPAGPMEAIQRLEAATPALTVPVEETPASVHRSGAGQELSPVLTGSAPHRAQAPTWGVGRAVTWTPLDEDARTDMRPSMPKECWPEARHLYWTQAAGPDGCGVLVDASSAWSVDVAAAQITAAEGGTTAMAAHPRPGSDGIASLAPDRVAAEVSADGGSLPGRTARRLLIDQAAQVMRVYENGAETRILPVSTGMLTSKTFTRAWQGTVGRDMGAVPVEGGMYVEQAWYLFPDVFGNILIHSVPYVQQGTLRVYDQPEALGIRPSSHGCIRISEQDARWLREWDPVGASIEITGPPGPVRRVD